MVNHTNIEKTIVSVYATEALADIDHYESETLVSIPTFEAVERAKSWIEENEK